MRVLFVSWSLLGLFATWTSAIVYQDLEYGAIVIEDTQDDTLELEPAEEATTQIPGSGFSCTNTNGISGTCMSSIQDCYPYVANYESGSFDSFQLYDILKETVEPCAGHSDLICCPDHSLGLPIKKAQYEGQTTEASSPTPNLNSTTTDEYKNRNDCGANLYQDLKVVGGREAAISEFPYMVALINNGRQFCGGSLISDQWVLTAAHCIVNLRSFSKVAVHTGDHDVSKQSEVEHQKRGVKRGLYHKDFSMRNLQHDVALLQLDRPVTLSDKSQPICLSESEPPYGEKAVLSGWGKTGKNLPPSSKLRTVKMRIIPHKECQEIYSKEPMAPPVTQGMVCAGEGSQGSPSLKDACNGDSGGPLAVFKDGGKAVLQGIVSWGIGCGDKPGVYTRVDKYRTWIDKNSRRS